MRGGTVSGSIGGGLAQFGRQPSSEPKDNRSDTVIVKGKTLIEKSGGTVEKNDKSSGSASIQIHNEHFDGAIVGGGISGHGGSDLKTTSTPNQNHRT